MIAQHKTENKYINIEIHLEILTVNLKIFMIKPNNFVVSVFAELNIVDRKEYTRTQVALVKEFHKIV